MSPSMDNRIFVELPTTINAGGQHVSHSSNAKANAGESFISQNGNSWIDFTSVVANANVCVKAFTKTASNPQVMLQGIDNLGRDYESDAVHALDDLKAQMFGYNEEFVEEQAQQGGFLFGEMTLGSAAPSVLPDLNTNHNYAEGCVLPERYDLRDEGCLTAVRDQGQLGTCWTFAAYGSLESAILKSSATSASLSSDGLSQGAGSAASIVLDPSMYVMAEGNQIQITATVLPYGSNEKLIWTSSNTAVATVSSRGLVTAVAQGYAHITATTADGSVSANCPVMVTKGDLVSEIRLNSGQKELWAGESLLIDYEVSPSTARDQEVTWSVSDESVASIDQFGMLTAKRFGTVTVTATSADGNVQKSITVEIQDDRWYLTEVTNNGLAVQNHVLSGSLSINVVNQAEEQSFCKIMVVVYDGDGRYLTSYVKDATLTLGDNPVTFSDIHVDDVSEDYRVKVFTLDQQSYTPLSPWA